MMKRIIEAEKEYKTGNVKKALGMFFKAFPELDYWKEEFEYMLKNNIDFDSDTRFADSCGTRNENWAYALHLDYSDNHTYICVIEREETE